MGMMRFAKSCLVMALLLLANVGSAYETSTHRLLTDTAVDQSVLARVSREHEFAFAREMFLGPAEEKLFRPHAWRGKESLHEDAFEGPSPPPFGFRPLFYARFPAGGPPAFFDDAAPA